MENSRICNRAVNFSITKMLSLLSDSFRKMAHWPKHTHTPTHTHTHTWREPCTRWGLYSSISRSIEIFCLTIPTFHLAMPIHLFSLLLLLLVLLCLLLLLLLLVVYFPGPFTEPWAAIVPSLSSYNFTLTRRGSGSGSGEKLSQFALSSHRIVGCCRRHSSSLWSQGLAGAQSLSPCG